MAYFKVTFTRIKYWDSCSKELGIYPTMFILESIFHKCERVLWRFLRAYVSPTQNHAYEPFLVSLIVLLKQTFYKNSKWVWSGNTTITNCRPNHCNARKSHTSITWHQEDKLSKNSKWVSSGNTTITNCKQPRGTARKSSSTITRHQEDNLSKAISSLFPIKMIAKLE